MNLQFYQKKLEPGKVQDLGWKDQKKQEKKQTLEKFYKVLWMKIN